MPQSRKRWIRADNLIDDAEIVIADDNIELLTSDQDSSTDEGPTTTGSTSNQPTLRGMNMNAYAQQSNSRQASRLQNTQKTAVGNGGWGNFGMIGAAGGQGGGAGTVASPGPGPGAGAGFGGVGAPGLGAAQSRPQQLSGFAQVMGGGGQQGPIDMR